MTLGAGAWLFSGMACLSLAAQEATWASLPKGVIHAKMTCLSDASLSYALYLPKSLPANGAWPLLMLFDPIGRAEPTVARFQAAADRAGVAILASWESRNALPGAEYDRILQGLMDEIGKRCPAGPRFVGGFSGGARLAVNMARNRPGQIQGVLAVGAFYDEDAGLSKTSGLDVVLASGEADYNYFELRRAEQELTTTGLSAWRVHYPGPHSWLPRELASDALEWLMLMQARRAGKSDPAREAAFRNRMFEDAGVLRLNGTPRYALNRIRMLAKDFPESDPRLEKKKAELETVPEVRADKTVEERYAALILEMQAQTKLDAFIDKLTKMSSQASKGSVFEQSLASGVVEQCAHDIEPLGISALQQKAWPNAAKIWHALTALEPKYARYWVRSAVALGQLGRADEAFSNLAQAVALGYADVSSLAWPEWEPLKRDPRFTKVKAQIEANAAAGGGR
jgi:hypothetical protein